MLGTSYYNFYNEITHSSPTATDIIKRYTNYIFSNYDYFYCGFGAIIENGVYKVIHNIQSTFEEVPVFSLLTQDINKDMYNLEPITIIDQDYYAGFSFLNPSSYEKLTSTINSSHQSFIQMVCLQIFQNGDLVAHLVFATDKRISFTKEIIEELTFIRNNIESVLYPVLHLANDDYVDTLLDTAESILSSKHYQTGENSVFMSRLLSLIFETSDEADYGSALYYDNAFWYYADAVGHDASALAEIRLPGEIFFNEMVHLVNRKELAPDIYLIDEILETIESRVDAFDMDKIIKASKPIKQTIQLYLYANGAVKGIISLDIAKNNPSTFTKKTVNLLRKIQFIGQVLFTYGTMISKTESFEHLTGLISKLIVNGEGIQQDFLVALLKLLIESLDEADYATAYIRDNKSIRFLATEGHSLKGLQDLNLKPKHFVDAETIVKHNILTNEKNPTKLIATLFSDIQKYAKNTMDPDLFRRYMIASKPIKDGLISQMQLDEDVYMYISCDIKKGSPLSFSKESIHLFSVLNNLGFAFISNEYFINKYIRLNEELESIIQTRTLELEETNRKLQLIVNRDSLTGLLNHKTIISNLETLIRTETVNSIFLFDIDHFKVVNDTYGHQVGDEVLEKISSILHKEEKVISGRYGGEEFLILLPNTDLPEAITFANYMSAQIKALTFKQNFTITVSGGVTTSSLSTATKMIKIADKLLYQAKSAGRSQSLSDYC